MCFDNLRKAQLIQTQLLKKFKHICEAEGMCYYLFGGTALGAVRHQGFIPWDDDIDVGLFRRDYDHFLQIAPKYLANNEEIRHFTKHAENSTYFIKLIDNTVYFLIQYDQWRVRSNIWLDIFPIDGTPNSVLGRWIHYRRIDLFRMLKAFGNANLSCLSEMPIMKRFFFLLARHIPLGKLIDPIKINYAIDKEFKKYPVNSSKYVGNYLGSCKEREIFPKDYFAEGRDVIFEKEHYKAPKELEKYLSQMYGDYMSLPPENKRVPKQRIIEIIFEGTE